jgi:DNA-binding NarL/FixJ family response regulator
MRVLVVAQRPLARAGLRSLLPEQEIAGEASSLEQAAQLSSSIECEVVFIELNEDISDEWLHAAEGLLASGKHLVTIGEPSARQSRQLIEAGVRGILPMNAGIYEVSAALQAAARGLLVLDPKALQSMLSPQELNEESSEPDGFTEREKEVLDLLARGWPNRMIANKLQISEHTVKFHVASLLNKLGASSRTEAVTRAVRRGLLAL